MTVELGLVASGRVGSGQIQYVGFQISRGRVTRTRPDPREATRPVKSPGNKLKWKIKNMSLVFALQTKPNPAATFMRTPYVL